MELCFTGISSKKGIPAAKAAGIPFLRGEKSFRHAEAFFRTSRSSEKWGSSSCRTPFRVSRTHPSAPLAKGSHFGGRLRVSRRQKPSGYPFCMAKSLFATQRHFSELQEVLKNGDHHRAGHPSGFPAHTLPPRWRKALTLGADSGYPGGKSRRDTLFFIVSPVRSAGGAIFPQNMTTYRNLRCEYCDLYSFFRRRTPRL